MNVCYPVVLEDAGTNWCAFAPDVLGCIATGKTREQTLANLTSALLFHFEGMNMNGEEIPIPNKLPPNSTSVEVTIPKAWIISHVAVIFNHI